MLDALYKILIMPIQMVVEMTYSIMYRFLGNKGLAIIAVSLVIQTLVLPLYKRSDALQDEERRKQAEMSHWVSHIRKTFKGDERFMMLSTYYRQQNYKTYYTLKSSFSILLQIPFFLAAYHYLSNLKELQGTSFLMITDLGQPDQMLSIFNHPINVLPILMTLINIISGIIYTRGLPAKSKIQVYGLAVIFLVLLYNSPSGLVLYWTMNNVYSLLKNIFMKIIKRPTEVISCGIIAVGIGLLFFLKFRGVLSKTKVIFILGFIVFGLLLLLVKYLKRRSNENIVRFQNGLKNLKVEKGMFAWETILLTIFLGLLIPVSVIETSATEFIVDGCSPVRLIYQDGLIYTGIFIVWFSIFYFLMPQNVRKIFSVSLFALSGCGIVNYMFFGTKLGNMSAQLIFEQIPSFSLKIKLINSIVILIIFCILSYIAIKRPIISKRIVQLLSICMLIICGIHFRSVNVQMNEYEESRENLASDQIFTLSREGNNVVVFMLDRSIGSYIPYIFDEKPELKNVFSGFTYYPNTISFGGFTNFATPALFGGYEYTPTQINKRADESLESKQNEAISVLPVLFMENGYDVTVCDPPYAGYQWIPDISIYDKYEGINAYITEGAYRDVVTQNIETTGKSVQESNFIYYSLMKIIPLVVQPEVYADGRYFKTVEGVQEKHQISEAFINSYSALLSLKAMTNIVEGDENTFLMLQNSTTHEPVALTYPDYLPGNDIDIDEVLSNQPDRVINGQRLRMDNELQLTHYQVNVASLEVIGEWLMYLKQNDVYDNTRIIIVSDHGRGVNQIESMSLENGIDVEFYNPTLLVKDFGEQEYKVSDEFMTNADVPTMAVKDLIVNPINPFTGNVLTNSEKYEHPQRITTSCKWDINENNGNVFDTSDGKWYQVHDNIFDVDNWRVE